jgi:inner membrane protein
MLSSHAMDPVTHALAGLVLGTAAGDSDRRRLVMWTAAALVPDVDGLASLAGRGAYYEWHRALGHGLPAAVALTLAVALVGRRLGVASLGRGLAMSGAAILSHLFLDCVGSHGTLVFWPFNRMSVELDLLFIVDLWFSGILVLGLLVGFLTRLGRARCARAAILLAALYVAGAAVAHGRALARVEELVASGRVPGGAIAAVPQPFSFLSWAGFVTNADGIYAGNLRVTDSEPPSLELYPRPANSESWALAQSTEAAQRFLSFARFPRIEVAETANDVTYLFTDLRFTFSRLERSNDYFGTKVVVGRDGRVHFQGLTKP